MSFRAEICREIKSLGEYLSEGFGGKCSERLDGIKRESLGKGIVEAIHRKAEDVIQCGSAEYSPKNGAFDVSICQNCDEQKREYGNDQRHNGRPIRTADEVERRKRNAGRFAGNDKLRILKTEESDKQTDSRGDCSLNDRRNGFENNFAKSGCGQQHENKSVDKHEHKRVCVGKAESKAYRIHKERIESHSGSLRKRQIGKKTDKHRSYDGGKRRRNIHGVERYHAESCKHSGVYDKYVCHCEEGSQSRNHLCSR